MYDSYEVQGDHDPIALPSRAQRKDDSLARCTTERHDVPQSTLRRNRLPR